MDDDLASFVANLPKCELHLHLEGTLSPSLKLRLAQRNGVDIGQTTVADVEATYEFNSLTSFLKVYYPAMKVLVTAEDFAELSYEYLAKAASQNVLYAEMFFDPQAHTDRGVPFATVIDGYRQGILRAEKEFGIAGALIMCFLRDLSADSAMTTLEASLPYKQHIIGVGLDSDERDNPPSKFAAVFARARQEGYHLTMHCDIDQVGSIDNIRSAIHDIGVDRIDHGTNIVEASDLVDYVRTHAIGLTSCPISNNFVTKTMKAPELVSLLRGNVKITVNSDDPAYFKGYMTENFTIVAQNTTLSRRELVQLSRNAFEIAWITPDVRKGYLAKLDAFAAASGLM